MRSIYLAVFVIATILGAAVPGLAIADREAGVAALEREDYEEARREFQRAAEEGDRFSQFNLAVLHERGQGGPRSGKLAADWFRKAAIQGGSDAAFALGLIYETGRGMRRDSVEAYMWYRVAEKGGHQRAKMRLRRIKRTMTIEQVMQGRKAANEQLAED